MNNISSIHIEKGHVGEFFHNSREKNTVNSIFDTSKNITTTTAIEAIELYKKELEIRTKEYTKRTGQKLQKNTATLLSAIVNIKPNTTLKDLQKLSQKLEEKLGTKIIQISIHRDEGHNDKNGNEIINHHAHLMMLGLDEEGRSIRRKFKISLLRELQDITAQVLEMERGKKRKIWERKRLGTYEYKKAMLVHNNLNKDLETELKNELKKELKLDDKNIEYYINLFTNHLDKENTTMLGNYKKQDIITLTKRLLKTIKTDMIEKDKEIETLKKDLQGYKKALEITKNEIKQKDKNIQELNDLANNLTITVKQLQEEIKNIKQKMIETNKNKNEKVFTQQDYIYLNKLKKELNKSNLEDIYNKVIELKKQITKQQNKKEYNPGI
jgi:hypothetical protein